MDVLLTLNSGLGANLGPNFNLTANPGHTVTPNTATRAELIAGKMVSVSPEGATIIFVTSTGVCTNQLLINIAGITTSTTTSTTSTSTTSTSTTSTSTTSTSTTSTTTVAPISFVLTYDASVGGQACANFANNVGKTTYYTPGVTPLADGVGLFSDSLCTTFVDDGYYSDGTNWWYASGGTLSTQTTCSIEWYTLTKCFGSGTITTKAYPLDTFNVNDRVHIGTAPNQTYYTITTVHTSDPGGSHTSPISDSTTLCPTAVDYTISADCPYPLGKITVNTLSGGLGTYEITTNLYSTSVAALAATAWESITTSKDYTSVSDGTYYVAVRDAGNIENIITKSVVVACTTTTTTSTSTSTSTTSTTTEAPTTTTTTAAPTSTTTTTTIPLPPGETSTTTTTTTAAPTSTTTTTAAPTSTTTTEAPTTTTTSTSTSTSTSTTTTAAPACKEYQITSTDPTYGATFSATNCDNTPYNDYNFFGTVNLCFIENTISIAGGTYSLVGDCAGSPTTTTTTAAPTTTTTTSGGGGGTTTTTTASTYSVTINLCAGGADGSGTVTAYAYSNFAVDTSINIPIKWTGDLASELLGSITISVGQTCGSTTLSGAVIGENYSDLNTVGDISPLTYGTQEYFIGFAGSGSPCATC